MRRIFLRISLAFFLLVRLLGSVMLTYWNRVLEPRLAQESQLHAKILADTQSHRIISALHRAQDRGELSELEAALKRMLAIKDPGTDAIRHEKGTASLKSQLFRQREHEIQAITEPHRPDIQSLRPQQALIVGYHGIRSFINNNIFTWFYLLGETLQYGCIAYSIVSCYECKEVVARFGSVVTQKVGNPPVVIVGNVNSRVCQRGEKSGKE